MGFTQAVGSVLTKYAVFHGRASRAEYWWWFLFVLLLFAVLNLIDGYLILPMLGFQPFEENGGNPLSVIVALGMFLPNLAVAIRRLHDTDRTGWWVLIGLVPVVGVLVLLYFYVLRGTEGPNSHGEPPH